MNRGTKTAAGLAMALGGIGAGAGPVAAQERPIDRWLLSRAFSAASVPEEGPLPTVAELNPLFAPADALPPTPTQLEEDLAAADSLAGRPSNRELDEALGRRRPRRPPPSQQSPLRPGWMVRRDSVLFPERGTRVGATVWTLVRQDGNPTFELDALVDRSGPTAMFAHAYIRPPADQTVRLLFTGLGCTAISARLNEQPVPLPSVAGEAGCAGEATTSATVRLAAGWNALLVRADGEGAPYGFAVSVGAGPDGKPVEDLRIQASRPPGIRPVRLDSWIEVVGIRVPAIEWRGGDLAAEVAVDFRIWGDFPPEDAKARLEVGGEKAEHRFGDGPTDGSESVVRLVRLDKLRDAALGSGAEIELEWEDHEEEVAQPVLADALLTAFHQPIRLSGWLGVGARLPGQGAVLSGEWQIPGWLEGFTLLLSAAESPATYSLGGEALELEDGTAVLCGDCSKGARLTIEAATTGEWTAMPTVRIAGPSYADGAAGSGSPPADDWLRALDEDGSARYRELLTEFAGGGSGP